MGPLLWGGEGRENIPFFVRLPPLSRPGLTGPDRAGARSVIYDCCSSNVIVRHVLAWEIKREMADGRKWSLRWNPLVAFFFSRDKLGHFSVLATNWSCLAECFIGSQMLFSFVLIVWERRNVSRNSPNLTFNITQ